MFKSFEHLTTPHYETHLTFGLFKVKKKKKTNTNKPLLAAPQSMASQNKKDYDNDN